MPRSAPPKKRTSSRKPPSGKPSSSKPRAPKRKLPPKSAHAKSAKPPVIRRSPTRPFDQTAPDEIRPLALAAIEAALDKKAERPTLLDVRQLSSYADYVLVLSGDSERQLDAITRSIEDRLRALGKRVRGIEAGAGESSWILMDFGDLVIHVFLREARDFYDLEGLWHDAPRVTESNAATPANR